MNYNIDFINDKKHIRVPDSMINSKYYNYILSPTDVRVFTLLWDKVIPSSKLYKNGLLVVNLKQATISKLTGLSRNTVKRTLIKLNKIGVIITLHQKQSNNKYIIGFRTEGNEWLLFLHYLINKYEEALSCVITEEVNDKGSIKLPNPTLYRMNKDIKTYITNNFNNSDFFTKKIMDDKTIIKILFNREDFSSIPMLKIVKNQSKIHYTRAQNGP